MPATTSPPRPVARHAWKFFLAVGVVLLALYLWVPPLAGSAPVINALGLAPVLAIFVGVRMHRPAAATAWTNQLVLPNGAVMTALTMLVSRPPTTTVPKACHQCPPTSPG